jgi:hypothetical protein
MDEKIPERLVCPHCGGTELSVNATAWWDEEKQTWDFSINDGADDYCGDCLGYVCGEFVPITDVKSAALAAIRQNEVV